MKMDIELTDEQFEKVKILEENNISVGEAIDILFEMKDNITKHSGLYLDSRIARAEEEKGVNSFDILNEQDARDGSQGYDCNELR